MATWAFFAVYQSLILYSFVIYSSTEGIDSSGRMFGLWDVSTMAYTCVVVTVNLRLLMMCNTVTRWHHISVGGSILLWFIFVFIYSGIHLHKEQVSFHTYFDRFVRSIHFLTWLVCNLLQEGIYLVIIVLISTLYFYLTLLLVPVAALFVDFLYQG